MHGLSRYGDGEKAQSPMFATLQLIRCAVFQRFLELGPTCHDADFLGDLWGVCDHQYFVSLRVHPHRVLILWILASLLPSSCREVPEYRHRFARYWTFLPSRSHRA